MQLLSLLVPLALLAPAFAGTHNARSEQFSRHRKSRTASEDVHSLERRLTANGGHVRYSYYEPETFGAMTACGKWRNSNDAIVAIPIQQFSNSMCGQHISISYKGRTVSATIDDACVGCPDDSLDLTPMLFRGLDDTLDAGYLWGGSWNTGGGGGGGKPKPEPEQPKPQPPKPEEPKPKPEEPKPKPEEPKPKPEEPKPQPPPPPAPEPEQPKIKLSANRPATCGHKKDRRANAMFKV